MSAGLAPHSRGRCNRNREVLAGGLLLPSPLTCLILKSWRVTQVLEDAAICCSPGLNSSPYNAYPLSVKWPLRYSESAVLQIVLRTVLYVLISSVQHVLLKHPFCAKKQPYRTDLGDACSFCLQLSDQPVMAEQLLSRGSLCRVLGQTSLHHAQRQHPKISVQHKCKLSWWPT